MMRKKKREVHPQDQEKASAPSQANSPEGLIPGKKPVRSQGQTAGVLAVEVAEVEVIGIIEQDSVDETETAVRDMRSERP
jgi:hypothetical protein